jgi:hypothetical protein
MYHPTRDGYLPKAARSSFSSFILHPSAFSFQLSAFSTHPFYLPAEPAWQDRRAVDNEHCAH